MSYGTVVLLNGPSAAGKTSIQKKFQESFKQPFLRLGIDDLFDKILPDYYGLGEIHPKGNFLEKDIRWVETIAVEGKEAVKLHVGPLGRKVIAGMHQTLAAYAEVGNNIIVDYILYDQEWFPELVKALESVKVYYVGLQYPLEVLEQREKQRANSPVGHSRSHYKQVHHYSKYDLVLNDYNLSPEKLAEIIANYIETNPEPKAFKYYQEKFN